MRLLRLGAILLGIAVPIFLFLWTFQLVRELGYWIEHGHSAMTVNGQLVEGKLRIFSGVPRELPDRLEEQGFDPSKDLFKIIDLGLHKTVGRDDYEASFTVETIQPGHLRQDRSGKVRHNGLRKVLGLAPFHPHHHHDSLHIQRSHKEGVIQEYSLVSKNLGGKRDVEAEGWRPGERIVTFVFSGALQNSADWVRAGLIPDLIIVHWADWPGYLRQSLHAELFLEALLMAAFLVWHFVFLREHGKSVFRPGQIQNVSKKTLRTVGAIALTGIVLYQFPLFHNVVFLWFGAWTLLAILVWKFLLVKIPRAPLASRGEILALVLVIAAGMTPRIMNLDWGNPLMLHPDEYAFTDFPPRMAQTNSLNPGDFERPNHPSIYTNSMVYGVVSQVVFGKPLPAAFAEHPFFFHLISRWIVALWGGVGIFACWLVGRRFHPLAGFWAAVLMAIHPAFLEHAHYATPDVPMTAMQLFSIWLSLRFFESRSWRDLAPAILWVSLASGEKYPGILYLVAPLFALAWSHRENWKGWPALAKDFVRLEAVYLVGLFAFAPFVFLNVHLVVLNLISESRPTHLGQDGLTWVGNLLYYLQTYLDQGSLGLLVLAIVGGILAVRRFGARSVPLLSGLFYWVFVSRLPLHWERWSLPMIISPLILSAITLGWAQTSAWKAKGLWKGLLFPLVAVTVVLLAGQIFRCEVIMARLGAVDTRLAGLSLLEHRGINNSNAVVSQYTPLAPAWKPGFDFVSAATDSVWMVGKNYAVSSSFMYDRFLAEPQRYQRETEFYQNLFKGSEVLRLDTTPFPSENDGATDWKLAARVVPFWQWWMSHQGRIYIGPTIRVFELSKTPNPAGT